MRFARRCARMPSSASAKLNGSMPMSSRRMIDSGAEFVCSVANTRWPVSEASMPVRGGLLVAHLADHDDVRVGAQERLHHRREVEAGLLVHLHLAQALLRDFDRVLRGPDLGVRRVEELEHRVQRGRLARAGRAADEEQAVRLRDRGPAAAPGCAARSPSSRAGSARPRRGYA